MSTRPTERGFTLFEILIASTIAAMLLGVLVSLVVSSVRVSHKGAVRAELQQRAMLLSEKLTTDLKLASPSGIGISAAPDPPALSLHPRLNTFSTVAWEPDLVLYRLNETLLHRHRVPSPGGSDEAYRPDGPEDWTGLLSLTGQETFRVKGVETFEVTSEPGRLYKFRFKLVSGEESYSVTRALLVRQGA